MLHILAHLRRGRAEAFQVAISGSGGGTAWAWKPARMSFSVCAPTNPRQLLASCPPVLCPRPAQPRHHGRELPTAGFKAASESVSGAGGLGERPGAANHLPRRNSEISQLLNSSLKAGAAALILIAFDVNGGCQRTPRATASDLFRAWATKAEAEVERTSARLSAP